MIRDLMSPGHIIIIFVIVLLVFGPSRLPELGSAVGKTFREFKEAITKVSVSEDDKGKE